MKVALTSNEFNLFSEYIIQNWGIDLDDSKKSLLESRLRKLLQKYHCSSFSDLYHQVNKNREIAREIIDAISTNETSFFREEPVFDLLKNKLIPSRLQKNLPLSIWSAACSTGQEAYTLAILLKELDPSATFNNYQITATDISDSALEQAKLGEYTQQEVTRGLNTERLNTFFHRSGAPRFGTSWSGNPATSPVTGSPKSDNLEYKESYQVNDDLKSLVQFQNINLTTRIPYRYQFDIVLCRNVTIYFNLAMKRNVYDQIANTLKPKGFLILGSAENLFEISDRFERCRESVGPPHDVLYYQLIE